ncbi:MAG: response regulator [Acidobacteria bacterium]|nr:response regulator [Acidobacteriota bacterium]
MARMEKDTKQIRAKILVVDDEPSLCELIEAVLLSAGMEVRALTSSAEVFGVLAKEKFDAVFLDVHMPSPNGVEVAQQMRAGGFNMKTPIVMITGDADPTVLKKGFESGANFFLFKPVDRRGILRLVRATQGSILNEKRRFQRVGIACPLTIECRGQQVKGKTIDLSLNGALAEADSGFDVDSRVDVQLQLGGGAPLRVRGNIVRRSGNRMGILFDQMATSEGGKLQEFLLPHILASMERDASEMQA